MSALSQRRVFLAAGDIFDYAGACLLSRYVSIAVSSIFHVTTSVTIKNSGTIHSYHAMNNRTSLARKYRLVLL
jgi:hypothetical protein